MEKRFGVAVLGAGKRARYVVKNLLRDSGGAVRVVSAFDPDWTLLDETLRKIWGSSDALAASSAEEAIHAPGVDWVMVFSPNSCHRDHILAAFAAGKDVFAEKPLATTIDACKEISEAQRRSGRVFATGFVLRYAPIYRRAKELLDSGMFGRLLLIEGNENIAPDHGGYIMCNWRRLTKFAGPHILEKCCHDLDLINWFCGSLPSRVASFGGRDFFKPENNRLMEKYGEKTFKSWWDPHAQATPFTDDTDLMDNQVSIAEFRNRIRVTFTATMSNAIPERRLSFACAEGTMKLNLYSNIIRYRRLGDEGVTELNFSGDGHGGGDSYIMKELYETMSRGVPPKCSGAEGLRSAVFALALDQAARNGEIVDLEPVWKALGE